MGESLLGAAAVTIIPLPYFFCQNMVGELRKVAEEKMESLVGTLARRNEDCAQVLGVDDHLKRGIKPVGARLVKIRSLLTTFAHKRLSFCLDLFFSPRRQRDVCSASLDE